MSDKIKIVAVEPELRPIYMTEGSVGMDLKSSVNLVLEPMQRRAVPTGVFLELPKGFEAQVRPRSGLALKYGVTVLNSPGTIDWDYRGEIKVILINLGQESFEIKKYDRIAQMIVSPVCPLEQFEIVFTSEISESARGPNGFGHTG